jgi:alpha-L-fucosidase
MNRERIQTEAYERYGRYFEPDLFDPVDCVRQAQRAGMKYIVLTTKHHEGFCLWDSKLTDYTVMNTPYGKDIVASYVEAVRAAGLKVGFYHSLLDWHHPDFLIDGHHPRRDDPDAEAQNAGRDPSRYRAYLHGQVRELLTRYGKIDYIFYDFSYEHSHHGEVWGGKGEAASGSEELLTLTRELQPGILVNDRLGIPGDFVTPEQYQPAKPMEIDGHPVRWEACQTLNGSWGYFRDSQNDKPVDLLVRMLIDGVSKNGNLLLTWDPPPVATSILVRCGRWRASASGWTCTPDRSMGRAPARSDHRLMSGTPSAQPAVRSHFQLAARASSPARSRREGRVRTTSQRRLGDRLPCHRPGGPRQDHWSRWSAARHPDTHPADTSTRGRGASRRAFLV